MQISDSFTISGHSVTLIDTPGFDDTTISDTDVLKMIAGYLITTYVSSNDNERRANDLPVYSYKAGFKLSGLIYMHRITDRRVGGMSRKNFSMLRKLCGDATLKNVAIVTSMWDQESSVERAIAREEELMTDDLFFKPVLDKGAQMLRHDRGLESARDIVSRFITKTPMALQIQRELVEDQKLLEDTAAGVAVQGSLAALIEDHKREIQALREDMRTAIRERDEETRQELEDERKKLEGLIVTMEEDRARLSREFEEERKKADEEIQQLREEMRRQHDQLAAKQGEIEDLASAKRGGMKKMFQKLGNIFKPSPKATCRGRRCV